MFKGFLLCCLLLGTAWAELDVWVQELGAPELEVRNRAQDVLSAKGAERPRQTITELAGFYRTAEDLEVQARLEVILRELAREWMFYLPPGFLGINFQMIGYGEGSRATEVRQVIPGGAADQAGLKMGDLILKLGDVDIGELSNQEAFVAYVATFRPGTKLFLEIKRGDTFLTLPLEVGVRGMAQLDVVKFSEQEEEKLQKWLEGLRGEQPQDPLKPVGHFKVTSEEDQRRPPSNPER